MNIQNLPVAGAGEDIPPLPHLVRSGTSIQIGAAFDRDAVAPLLPSGIELTKAATGGFNFVDGPDGWGLTPYRMLLIWLDVEGYLSETGQSCRYKVHVHVEGGSNAVRHYKAVPGHVTFRVDHDQIEVTTGPLGRDHVRARAHISSPAVSTPDTRNYLIRDAMGGLNLCPVSSLANRSQCDRVTVDILGGDETLLRLAPTKILWSWFKRDLSFTCGAWIPLRQADRSRAVHGRSMFVNFLSRFDRAIALVERDGRVVLMNGKAERLLGGGLNMVGGRLHAGHPGSDAVLHRLIDTALGAGAGTARLDRPDRGIPLIVKGMPFELDLPGTFGPDPTRVALLVFADPGEVDALDTVPALQLLGLTLSEAKASALVGQGLSPRETAAELGLAENTVRTTIKRVFSKLELSRQSELAVLVSRIASIGA